MVRGESEHARSAPFLLVTVPGRGQRLRAEQVSPQAPAGAAAVTASTGQVNVARH
jgi:hypothetical protein